MIVVPHGSPYAGDSPAPCWVSTLSPDDGWKVVVKCGNGHAASLANHAIDPDGIVTPQLACPEDGCGWFEDIRLEGWPSRA